ncbi:class I SAM-dependent methyltransferase [Methylophilus sp.]|jgi:SAM-dependent methyltransferase|uniref:class I SAM-dependent methyltransferase n=1 Tax=Methylophilus sp. TaxID=29541 RepID=UPI0011D38F47|nr:class I SAM-dependent methyltransferase [Methylophilus sp.]TXI46812.1 MAG: class I SAM-dependent methyltransferase [Methylophilus sp.]
MSISMPLSDKQETIERYSSRYQKFGYSPKSLGWDKGKQDVRFEILTSQYDFSEKSILDIGCGFGDLNKTLNAKYANNYSYLGVDLVPDLVIEARKQYVGDKINFRTGDFLDISFENTFDFVIASGIFNHRLNNANNYDLIEAAIIKALSLSKDGLAFDFLSDKVDYQLEHTFHSSPEKILSIAYKYSRNIVMRNDYMPFEFALFIFKDDSFSTEDTLFNRFKKQMNK